MQININGKQTTVDVAGDTPLLWVLRDHLNLTAAKYGCGIGQCGACTVHVDGNAVRSCAYPVSAVGDAQVVTLEGLDTQTGSALKEAWVDAQVPQCGYCQPGMIMTAAATIQAKPGIKAAELKAQMTNICRCGSYGQISDALQRVLDGRQGRDSS